MWQRVFPILGLVAIALPVLADEKDKQTPAPASKTAVSKITHVTVYPNSALVTREVDVPAGTGIQELVVNPLPAQTLDSSLYSEGTDGIRVLTTRYRTQPIKEDHRVEVRELEDKRQKLMQEMHQVQADIEAVQKNLQMLNKMEDFTASNVKGGGEKAPLNSESVIALAKYVMENRATKTKELVGLQETLRTNQEQAQFVQKQLQDAAAGTSRVTRDAVIVVDKANNAGGTIRLNYLVNSASWRPNYKFRAGKKESDPIQIEYLSAILQQSGEDWTGVKLTLCTAQPSLNAAPPDLDALKVAVVPKNVPAGQPAPQQAMNPGKAHFERESQMLRKQAQENYINKDEGNATRFFNEAAAKEQTWSLLHASRDEIRAMVSSTAPGSSNEGPSVTFEIKGKLSIPSRHDEQVVEVAKLEMKPEYFYKAVPVLTSHVYRQANLKNESAFVLLTGEANMYQGTEFVGRMNMPLVAIGEEFTVGMGADPQLQVNRQMIDKTRTMAGGNQVHKFDYRILVSSYKKEPVTVQLWDRLPHGETESVTVKVLKSSEKLSEDALYVREDKPNNLLRWDLKLAPGMNGEKALTVNYEFQLELDKQMTIADFKTMQPTDGMPRIIDRKKK